jgi:hypothetical protein
MIISHEHKYLFIELPRTGSTAVRQELVQNYGGQKILNRHSTYFDFLKTGSAEEKQYFVFSCIRNPLDVAVSTYFQLKTNHNNKFTDPAQLVRRKTIVERMQNLLYKYVQRTDADFETFFLRFYILPYDNWASISYPYYNFVMRFENLQEDFSTALRMIGIEPKRPLPPKNVTAQRERDFLSYYSPKTIPRAKRVFGHFMKQWGYPFPVAWGDSSVSRWNQLEYDFLTIFRTMYWKHLRFRY